MESEAKMIKKYIEEDKEYFEDRLEREIETNRKGFIKLNLVDSDGNSITNAEVKVKQKTHDFNFGCNIFMLDEYETKEENDLYKEKFKKIFNLAVVPLYWEGTEPAEGYFRYEKNSNGFYRSADSYYFINCIFLVCHCIK